MKPNVQTYRLDAEEKGGGYIAPLHLFTVEREQKLLLPHKVGMFAGVKQEVVGRSTPSPADNRIIISAMVVDGVAAFFWTAISIMVG